MAARCVYHARTGVRIATYTFPLFTNYHVSGKGYIFARNSYQWSLLPVARFSSSLNVDPNAVQCLQSSRPIRAMGDTQSQSVSSATLKSEKFVLGIETSCDETGAAVVDGNGCILGECLYSQKEVHLKTGGIIPPVSMELHKKHIDRVVHEALKQSNITWQDLSAIATTTRPGLALCLGVGLDYSKQQVQKTGLPFIPVHHMEAHALTIRMVERVDFPFLVFLVSGGHCILAVVRGLGDALILGQTLDDAPGEAYDKTARRLKLHEHPDCLNMSGGQAIEFLATTGDHTKLKVKTPRVHKKNCNFSFSGLKNSVRQIISRQENLQGVESAHHLNNINDIAAVFQFNLTHQMIKKVARAMIYCQQTGLITPANQTLVVSGGVASNTYIRNALKYVSDKYDYRLMCPPARLCTDNGVMIAWAGMEWLKQGSGIASQPQNLQYEPKSPLGEDISSSVVDAKITVPAITFWKS